MHCYYKNIFGILVIALAIGVLSAMFLPQWLITVILALVIIVIGACLLKYWKEASIWKYLYLNLQSF